MSSVLRPWVGFVALALAVASCGADTADYDVEVDPSKVVDGPANTEQAVAVLSGFYGLASAPEVYWYGGAALDCGDGHAFELKQYGWCLQGITLHDRQIVLSDYWPGQYGGLVSVSALAHEMGHVASYQHGEGGDRSHTGHYFADGGEVDKAYAMLEAAGL